MPKDTSFFSQAKRVLKLARKPGKEEYLNIAKVTGLGIIVIGFIGTVIRLAAAWLKDMI